MAVCPLYGLLGREAVVARGKLNLWERYGRPDGAPGAPLQEALEACLLCGACAENCAVGLPVPELVKRARAELRQRQGRPLNQAWLLARLTWHAPRLTAAAAPLAPLLNRLKAAVGRDSGLIWRLWPHLSGALAGLPDLAPVPFRAQAPRLLPGRRGAPKAAFFVGCGVAALFPQAGLAFLRICRQAGIEVMMPPGQGCCGLLAASLGETDLAADLARRLVAEFADLKVDFVVTACASCAVQLQALARTLAGAPEEAAARGLAGKVREAGQFLVGEAAYRPDGRPLAQTVGFHAPCHLHRTLGIREEPRLLLQAALGELPVEPAAQVCCGLGGAFGLGFPELSRELAARGLAAFTDQGVDLLASSCSGCLLQLQAHSRGLKVVHLLELAAPEPEKG